MNFYTAAVRLQKDIDKNLKVAMKTRDIDFTRNPEECAKLKAHYEDMHMGYFRNHCRLGIQMMLAYREIAEEEGLIEAAPSKQTFFITIRPKDASIDFPTFMKKVQTFVNRACFIEYSYSFEQKGENMDELGRGFHVHIVARMKQKSKGQVIRDTLSTFKDICEPQCVDVKICKNPDSVIEGYLLNYESEDGHKIATKQWDDAWREREGIAALYKSGSPIEQAKSSPVGLLTMGQ